jgi:hypothetical protein
MNTSTALARPVYVQEAIQFKVKQLAEQELQKFLNTNEGREASLQGEESLGLKKVIQDFKVKWVIYSSNPCPYKSGSMSHAAWYEGVKQRQWDLQELLERNELD